MGDEGSAQTKNLENWMSELPEELKDVPLIYLAIPGSHDSMTYGIKRSNGLAPDADPALKRLYPLFRGTILRWTITQALDANQQLLIGIRYFDLRLATKTGSQEFFFTHGMYADEISQPLTEIKEFSMSHPGEVIILDFQHFYGFTPVDHHRLIRFLLNLYGTKLVPQNYNLEAVTLNSLARLRQQIVLIYRHQAVAMTNEFWLPIMMPSPWPKQDHVTGLMNYLVNVTRPQGKGFVHQAVLTPTPTFIALRWISNLKERCAIPVMKNIVPKLSMFSPGRPRFDSTEPAPVNVIIADFVDLNDGLFPKTVIDLNWKLLRNTDIVYHNG